MGTGRFRKGEDNQATTELWEEVREPTNVATYESGERREVKSRVG